MSLLQAQKQAPVAESSKPPVPAGYYDVDAVPPTKPAKQSAQTKHAITIIPDGPSPSKYYQKHPGTPVPVRGQVVPTVQFSDCDDEGCFVIDVDGKLIGTMGRTEVDLGQWRLVK